MVNNEEILKNFVEVELASKDDFLRVVETLTRIGVLSADMTKLYQSAHLLHKKNKYYIVSFKEMFLLDGKENKFTDEDKYRRNKIATLLEDWGLLKILNPEMVKNNTEFRSSISVIPYKDKSKYQLITKYTIGKIKRNVTNDI